MALPKVTPGSYNYGAYANPQQVKLADTSAIGKGLEKAAAGVTRALDIKRQEEQVEKSQEFQKEMLEERFSQQTRLAELQNDLIKQRQISAEERAKQATSDLKFQSALETAIKVDQINASRMTIENSKIATESIQAIRNNKELSAEEINAQIAVAQDNLNEYIESHGLIAAAASNTQILNVPTSEILNEEGKILKGLINSAAKDIVAFSDYDPKGLGAEFTFQYETGRRNEDGTPEIKPISLTASQVKSLLENADKKFETKHVFGTDEDINAVNLFKTVYANSAMKTDPLYYTDEGKLNEEEFVNMLMNDQTIVSQVAGTRSASSLFKTNIGVDYEPNNTKHREYVARYYAEQAMQSIKIQNPGIFDQPPTAKTQTGLTTEAYNKLGSQGEKENALKVELIRRAQSGDIDALKSNKAFENFMFDGKVYKGTIIDEDGDEVEKTFTPAEMVDQYVNMMPKTWRATTEGSIFGKAENDPNKYDKFLINQ